MQLFSQPPQRNYMPTVIPQDVPVYKIGEGKFFADDELYEAGSIIVWPEEPNQEMEPLNELAMNAMKDYLDKLDTFGKAAAEKAGKAYISLAHAFETAHALASQEGRRVTLLNGRDEVPILGAKRRGRPKAQKIEMQPDSAPVGTSGKLSVDGRQAANSVGI